MADEDEIVLDFNDSLLKNSDVSLLDGPCWLNDNLIGFCFEYFERERFNHSADKLCLISPSVTQLIKLAPAEELNLFLEPLNLITKEYVFLAINDNRDAGKCGGTHWSLMVYIRCRQEFQHYDSCSHSNKDIAKQLAYKIQPFVHAPRGRMKVLEMDAPQQKNGYDCGLFVISVAEHLCRELCEGYGISLNDGVSASSMDNKRQLIKQLIHSVAEEFAGANNWTSSKNS